MAVTVYNSNDASAPALSGTAGTLAAVLYACLVTGYGSKSAAGWAREFPGTNKAVFRAAAGTSRMRLRIDDTGTQEARIVGYETMTDVDTGTNPFPTAAQVSGGLFVRKSNTADTATRAWSIVANDRFFWMYIDSGAASSDPSASATSIAANLSGCFGFGEFTSYKSGDVYNSVIIGAAVTGTSAGRSGTYINTPVYSASPGHYIARPYNAVAGAVQFSKVQALGPGYGNGNTIGLGSASNAIGYPDPVSGGLLISPLLISESGPLLRGVLPALWAPLHNSPGSHFDTVSGSGSTAGKTFRLQNCSDTTTLGRVLVETSDTW